MKQINSLGGGRSVSSPPEKNIGNQKKSGCPYWKETLQKRIFEKKVIHTILKYYIKN